MRNSNNCLMLVPSSPSTNEPLKPALTGTRHNAFDCEWFVTDSKHRRIFTVHKEAMSKARIIHAESAQNDLLSMTTHYVCGKRYPMAVCYPWQSSTCFGYMYKCYFTCAHRILLLNSWWPFTGTDWQIKSCLGCLPANSFPLCPTQGSLVCTPGWTSC